mmetsp:Transcript_7601/g.11610  ORF Transcript_7601/g.11610 Transcript_7601/m.11610 type:complete len:352 (+) Transcript_7601:142-1197(+)
MARLEITFFFAIFYLQLILQDVQSFTIFTKTNGLGMRHTIKLLMAATLDRTRIHDSMLQPIRISHSGADSTISHVPVLNHTITSNCTSVLAEAPKETKKCLQRTTLLTLVPIMRFTATAFATWQIALPTFNIFRRSPLYLSKLLGWYVKILSKFPLITKSLTTATIGFFGDGIAQWLAEQKRAKLEGSTFSFKNYDRRRGLSIVANGALITGPLLHLMYAGLEELLPVSCGNPLSASIAALSQVLIDDILVDAIFVAIAFITTGFGEGYSPSQIIKQMKANFYSTVKAGWTTSFILMPLEFVCFRFLPVSFRVLGMNFIDLIWDGTVSFMVHRHRKKEDRLSLQESLACQE